jgi:prophage tail gpP-like protein
MSRSYTVVQGDTYDTIARKEYGDDQQAGRIRRANPGADDPLVVGTVIAVPPGVSADDAGNRAASTPNEVALSVEGSRFRFWSKVSITRAIDAVPTVSFEAPFDPDNAEFRSVFRPFSFQSVNLDVGGDRLFTGTLIGVDPTLNVAGGTAGASCYALPGVLGDCTAPASAYPIEWDGADLRAIAESLAALFGIGVVFDGEVGSAFERLTLTPGANLLPWLAGLASQRDLVVGATPGGDLLFTKATAEGEPVAHLTQGESPCISVAPSFSPQDYFSAITGVTPTLVGLKGPQHTEKNTHLPGALRPHTFLSANTINADLPASVRSKMGRMFGNAIGYSVPVSTWRDPQGDLWKPNTLITLLAPGAMIYSRYTFLLRSVILEKTAGSESATLNLVLPGSFAGTIPEKLPWDE